METKYRNDVNHFFSFIRKNIMSFVFSAACLTVTPVTAQTAPNADHPPMPSGVVIKSLEFMEAPDVLKNQAKNEISQMKSLGYAYAPEGAISYIDRAVQTLSNNGKPPDTDSKEEKRLRPLQEIRSKLKVNPSLLPESIKKPQILGATPGGTLTEGGWTSLTRVFVVPKLGTLMLVETDYTASGGGLIMIKEAINQNINGHPAILRKKKSQTGKSITELTWATDIKIYNLSLNRMVKGAALDRFINIAQSITD